MRFFSYYLLCLLLLNLSACSSMQTVDLQRAVQTSNARGVEYGRLVEVKTLDKRTVKFRVTEVRQTGIGSEDEFFRFVDMKSLKVDNPNSTSSEETWTYVLGVIGAVALIALAISSDSVRVCSPSPCPED